MARNMSFAKTPKQMKGRTKTETRRFGWDYVKVGDEVNAVNKSMGFRKGEKPILIDRIRVLKTWREPLNAITEAGCVAEGFPELSPEKFVSQLFPGVEPTKSVRVIQFEFIDEIEELKTELRAEGVNPEKLINNIRATFSPYLEQDDDDFDDDDGECQCNVTGCEECDERYYENYDCGMDSNGQCGKAGSEECDWECPFGR